MPKLIQIILFNIFLFFIPLSAQEFLLKEYGGREGLQAKNIYYVIQTDDRIIWLATNIGILKYDGVSWELQKDSTHITSNSYVRFKFGPDRSLWALPNEPNHRIPYFNGHEWNSINPPPMNSNPRELLIYEKEGETCLIVSSWENELYINYERKWSNIELPSANSQIMSNLSKFRDNFVVSLDDGIYIHEESKLSRMDEYNSLLPSGNIQHLNKSLEDLWVLSTNWIGYFRNDEFNLLSDKIYLPYLNSPWEYSFISNDYQGRYYFGNSSGLFMFEEKSGSLNRISYEHGQESKGGNEIENDHEKNLWLATGRGLKKLRLTPFTNYNQSKGLPFDEVSAISMTDRGKIILGQNGSLSYIDEEKISTAYIRDDFGRIKLYARVMDIENDNSGNIWFCAYQEGLGILGKNDIQWKFRTEEFNINALYLPLDGTIWLGTDEGLKLFDGNKVKKHPTNINSSVRKIRKLRDRKYGAGVCTRTEGIYIIEDNQVTNYKSENPKGNSTYYLFDDKEYGILVGTEIGLFVVKDNSLQKLSIRGKNFDMPIYFINRHKEVDLWIGTNQGAYKLGPEGWNHYNIFNGLSGDECNRSAFLNDKDGNAWIGTDKGVSKYNPDYDFKTIDPSVCFITSVEGSSGIETKNFTDMEFPSNEVLVFNYRDYSYLNESETQYIISLLDDDDNLISRDTTKEKSVKFISLSPSEYTLNVDVINPILIESQTPASVNFRIVQPYYLRWWFLFISFGAVFLFGYVATKLLNERKYTSLLEKEVEKRTEEIRENEQNLSTTLDSIGDGVIVTDRYGLINRMNPVAEEITGWNQKEAIGQEFSTVFNIFDTITNEKADNPVDKVIRYGKIIGLANDTLLKSKSGISKPIADSAAPIKRPDGRIIGVIAVFRDLTEKYLAQKALKESEERFSVLTETAFEGIAILKELKIVYATEQFRKMLGYSEIELFGSSIEDIVAMEDREFISDILHSGKETVFSKQFYKKNKEHVIVEVRTRNIMFEGEEMVAAVMRDISTRKMIEDNLIKAKEYAEKSEKLKTQFLAQISHEIRTPINIILSWAGLLKDSLSDSIEDDLKESFSAMDNAGSRMIRTIDLILNTSEIQAGTYEGVLKTFNLKESVIEPLILEFKHLAEQKGITINLKDDIEERPKFVKGDKYAIGQIFDNLLDNAIKYTDTGSISLRIAVNHDNKLTVQVEDSGIGISEEYLPLLFNSFTQEEQGYTRKYEGSGLGLSLVKNYCDINGINISVESEKGKGSKFALTFENTDIHHKS